eukprot:TRINITY_DN10343_c0_g1_i1.p1 TRINITY_DN10343_c0_g1~~TRINITY_DN10343_c0_g1_i1.p1  ORF type:complete len:186 (-),score=7.81 TRINITY_DN10343_c0_g1_i1:131-688(-)
MSIVEVPIESRCAYITFSSQPPFQISNRIDHQRYFGTVHGLNNLYRHPRYLVIRIALSLFTFLATLCLVIMFTNGIIDYTLFLTLLCFWVVMSIVISIIIQRRMYNEILNFITTENLYYNQVQLALNYRIPWCYESPIYFTDYGGVRVYQTAVPTTTTYYQPAGNYQSNLQPVPIYYTAVPPPQQ